MSPRGRSTETPLSLFSFQDVITSITGIMILVVLMLVLEVISRKELKTPGPPPKGKSAAELEGEIAAGQATLGKLQSAVKQAEQTITMYSRNNPKEIAAAIEREEQKQRGLLNQVKKEGDKIARLNSQAEKIDEQNAQLTEEIEQLLAKLAELQRQLEALKVNPRVTFQVPRGTRKTPIVVRCSARGIRAKALTRDPEVKTFVAPGGDFQASVTAFIRWARTRNRRQDVFVVLVKPSEAMYARFVVDTLYRQKDEKNEPRFSVGYEPIEQEKAPVF